MKTVSLFVTTLLAYNGFECIKSAVILTPKIKYQINFGVGEYSMNNDDVVRSKENATSIFIHSDLSILRPGMLNISHPTPYFSITECSLRQIEPGAFDNQNFTGEISIYGNKLSRILTDTFKNLQVQTLDLWNNRINHIEDNAFSNLPNLVAINLGLNQLVEFSANSVLNTPKLHSFQMKVNKLKELRANSFNFLKGEVVTVDVSENDLQEIDPKALEGISVWSMNLGDNKLREIPEEFFSKNVITFLNLENNQFKRLPEAFYHQNNLTFVSLKGNPLECVEWKKLKKFEADGRVQIRLDNVNC